MIITHSDGKPFLSFVELGAARQQAEQELAAARTELTTTRTELTATRTELTAAEDRAAALAAKLRALGIDPDAV